jgi:hypothetical protein
MHCSVNLSAVGAWAYAHAVAHITRRAHAIVFVRISNVRHSALRHGCSGAGGDQAILWIDPVRVAAVCTRQPLYSNVARPLQAATAGCYPKAVKGVYVASRVVQDYPAKDDYALFMEMLQTAVDQDKVLCPVLLLTMRYCEVLCVLTLRYSVLRTCCCVGRTDYRRAAAVR